MQLIYDLGVEAVKVAQRLWDSYEIFQTLQTQSTERPPADTVPPLAGTTLVQGATARLLTRGDSTSSQLEPADFVAVATETSESASLEMSPGRDVEEVCTVKLSLWLQWTLLKFVAKVYSVSQEGRGQFHDCYVFLYVKVTRRVHL